jgi:hypothetical protein
MAIRYLSGINVDSNTLFVDAANNRVGIGTASPSYSLDIDGRLRVSAGGNEIAAFMKTASSFGAVISYQDATTPGSQFVSAGAYGNNFIVSTNGQLQLIVNSSGNVGIGTTSPVAKLHVYGGASSSTAAANALGIFEGGANSVIQINVPDANAAGLFFGRNGAAYYSGIERDGTNLFLKNNSSVRVSINSSGQVGVGSTSMYHSAALSVAGKQHFQTSSNTDIGGAIYSTWTQGANSSDYYAGDLRFQIFNAATGTYGLREAMMIDGKGYVGIGTITPAAKLVVSGSGVEAHINNGDTNTLALGNFSGGRHFIKSINLGVALTPLTLQASSFTFDTGNVGIGTTSPGYKLDVSGAGRFSNGHSGTLIVKHNYSYQQPNWAIKLDGDSGTSGGYLSQWVNIGGFELAQGATYYGGGPWRTDANSTSFAAVAGYGGILTFSTNSGLTANSSFSPSERMRITSAGNVGIGTTSPATNLDVNGSINIANGYNLTWGGAYGAGIPTISSEISAGIYFYPAGSTSGATMRITNGGNVLIGTTTDVGARLRIEGGPLTLNLGSPVNASAAFQFTDNSRGLTYMPTVSGGQYNWASQTNGSAFFNNLGSDWWVGVHDGAAIRFAANTAIVFYHNSAAQGIWNSTGLGIGTTAPLAKLHVSDVGADIVGGNAISTSTMKGVMIQNTNNGDESVGVWFNTGGNHWSGISGQRTSSATNWATDLRFYTHEAATTDLTYARERMRIDSEGNVGIGTTSPAYKFEVSDGTRTGVFNPNSALDGFFIGTKEAKPLVLGSSDTERMRITSGGNVGIGTTSPDSKLQVNSTGSAVLRMVRNQNNFGFEATNTSSGGYGLYDYQNNAYDIFFKAGNVGIGTTSPGSRLEISGTTGSYNSGIGFVPSGTGARNYRTYIDTDGSFRFDDATAWATRTMITSGGNVLIGTTTDNGYKLSVNGSGYFNGIGYFDNRVASNNSFSDANNVRILKPLGGSRNSFLGSETGAIKITYPVGWTNTMHRVKLNIYNYQDNTAYTVYFGGYNYGPGPYWVNTFAYTITPSGTDFNPTVRFGYDGTYMVVYIGELNSTWTYPQIFIEEVETGFNLASQFATDAWSIGLEASAFQNVTATRSNTQSTNWARNGSAAYYSFGNVGIGTTSPAVKLHVAGSEYIQGGFLYMDNALPIVWGSSVSVEGDSSAGSLSLKTASSARIFINSSGLVGIGTTAPQQLLHVLGATNGYMMVQGANDAGEAGIYFKKEDTTGTMNRTKGLIVFHTNVGSGYGRGHLGFCLNSSDSNTVVSVTDEKFRMVDNGDFLADGDVVAYSTTISDERYKTNITPIESALDKVNQMRGVSFDWTAVRSGREFGVIAQEIEKIAPEVVSEKELLNGETMKTVSYTSLVPFLIESIKELTQQVNELKAQLDGLTK